MTAEPTTRTTFKMGADVPEWLLSIDPTGPDSRKGSFRFGTDVDVFDTPDWFLIFPISIHQAGPRIFDDEGTSGCNVNAASKPVWIADHRSAIFPAEMTVMQATMNASAEWSHGLGQARRAPSTDPQRAALEREALIEEARRRAREQSTMNAAAALGGGQRRSRWGRFLDWLRFG